MSRQVMHDGEGAFRVRFPFDRRLVDAVKSLPRRRWNADGKYWWIPDEDAVPLVDLLEPEGFRFDETTRRLYHERGGTLSLRDGPAAGAAPAPPSLFDPEPAPPAGETVADAPADYTVSRLNLEVKEVLSRAFPAAVWIVGEVSGFNKVAHRRVAGFHLVERDESGRSVAEVNAVLFEEERRGVERRLQAAGGPFQLEDEVTVRVLARVELYEAWGQYRVRVEDLDVHYTLGEAARRREEIVRRLTEEGLVARNTSLPFPELPLRIGLVTSLNSDAYNDVLRTLKESRFAFRVTAHGARVQGRSTEPSVLNALDWFRARFDEFDVVLICRGGGSRTDLAWFDSEPLGRAVAEFPLPVVVGIGHEQDQSVLDHVGWRCKTPTAAAAYIVERVTAALERTEEAGSAILERSAARIAETLRSLEERGLRLVRAARGRIERERLGMEHRRSRVARGSRARVDASARELASRVASIPRSALLFVERRRLELSQAARQLVQGSRRDLSASARRIAEIASDLGPRVARRAALESERTDSRSRRLHLLDPRRVVERGYAILRDAGGRVILDAAAAPAGSPVHAELRRGALRLRSEGPEPGPEGSG